MTPEAPSPETVAVSAPPDAPASDDQRQPFRWRRWIVRRCVFLFALVLVDFLFVGLLVPKPKNMAYHWLLRGSDRATLDFIGPEEGQFEVNDPVATQALIDAIALRNDPVKRYCHCGGDVRLTFYRGERETARVSIHHGASLRTTSFPAWVDYLAGDNSDLTPESRQALADWFARHGFPHPDAAKRKKPE